MDSTSANVDEPDPTDQMAIPANRSVEEQATTPTISIIFNPSLRVDDRLPDTILVSSNQVHFYVHRHRILSSSYNAFNARLHDVVSFARGTLPTLYLPDSGDVLNVVVHTMYGLSCVHFHPAFDTVAAALPALARYGVPLGPSPDPTAPTSHAGPVHELVLAHAPYHPIDTYALAARHGLDGAAVAASGHLLAFDLSLVTDALATAMGPVYLKRLFLLHQARRAALREILLRAPARAAAHPPCDGRALLREWALVTASLVWDVTPGISPHTLKTSLEPIGLEVACETCREALRERIQDVVNSWSAVKATI